MSNNEKLNKKIIEDVVDDFKEVREPDHRLASYDYCYNYFYSFQSNPEKLKENKEKSSLYLIGFLASWGMLRGSSFLLTEKGIGVYKKLIPLIVNFDDLWEIDLEDYNNEENMERIIEFKKSVQDKWVNYNITDNLISKIMMGVYGCVPAFDNYFVKGARKYGYEMGKFENRLKEVNRVYNNHSKTLDSIEIKTLNFRTKEVNKRDVFYTKAKILDMIFWRKGGGKLTDENSKSGH